MNLATSVDAALEATIVGSFGRLGHTARSRLFRWEQAFPTLDGARILVTGGSSGLGLAASRAMSGAGAEVTIVGRNEARLSAAADQIHAQTGRPRPRAIAADLSSLAAAARLAEQAGADGDLDMVVHNAGALDRQRYVTDEGFERTYAVHVLAPHLLTQRLLPHLAAGAGVLWVSSGGMYSQRLDVDRLEMPEADYDGVVAYARAKRAQVVLAEQWADRVPDVWFGSMHPGWADTPGVQTSLPTFRTLTRPILRTPDQGADTIVWLSAVRPDPRGAFWLDRRVRSVTRRPGTAVDPGQARLLWDRVSEQTSGVPDRS